MLANTYAFIVIETERNFKIKYIFVNCFIIRLHLYKQSLSQNDEPLYLTEY